MKSVETKFDFELKLRIEQTPFFQNLLCYYSAIMHLSCNSMKLLRFSKLGGRSVEYNYFVEDLDRMLKDLEYCFKACLDLHFDS